MIQGKSPIGRVQVTDLPLPEGAVETGYATYIFSGKVLTHYKKTGDPQDKNWMRLAVLNDDGSDCHDVFVGEIPVIHPSGGVRLMPFRDNKRVMLGDFILECEPSLDNCLSSRLVRVEYPAGLEEDDPWYRRWSEIIVAPDNLHIAWTQLGHLNSGNYLAKLRREADKYTLQDVRIISAMDSLQPDEKHPGYMKIGLVRGGELKQFTRGGLAVSQAGSLRTGTLDSIEQDLDGMGVRQLTNSPGYEETTMLSEDGELGIAMSTRFSPRTNFAALALMPRPLGVMPVAPAIMSMYLYAVAGVRAFRKGNIGPVLYQIGNPDNCIDLHDPDEEWVYYSPLSWKPDGLCAMWNEQLRHSVPFDGCRGRIRIARLLDRKPTDMIPAAQIPENIPYARPWPIQGDGKPASMMGGGPMTIKVKGAAHGEGEIAVQGMSSTRTVYSDLSDDGQSFLNGYEAVEVVPGKTVYEAHIKLTGTRTGEMDMRLTLRSAGGLESMPSLSFDMAEDGKAESYGFARYLDQTVRIEDMLP